MCEFCAKHGEGRKWYLRARNYSVDLVKNSRRFRDMLQWLLTKTYPDRSGLATARTFLSLPLVGRAARCIATRRLKRDHFGQVLAIEDVYKVFRLADTITCYPCVCRRTLGAGRDRRYCFVLGNFMRELLDDSPASPAHRRCSDGGRCGALICCSVGHALVSQGGNNRIYYTVDCHNRAADSARTKKRSIPCEERTWSPAFCPS